MNRKTKYTLKDLQNHARFKGGKCHSIKYFRNDTKYDWECKSGHRFSASWGNIYLKSQWCRKCFNKSLRIDFSKIQKKIKEFGGKLITKERDYKNSKTKIKYTCDKGHEVVSSWGRLQQASINNKTGNKLRWCRDCAGKIKWNIKKLQEIAEQREGRLLSEKYIDQNQKLRWECKFKHRFKLDIHHINSANQWCPHCTDNQNISEKITRKFFEHIFKEKFPSHHPTWLVSKKSSRLLELDGYNKKLKIAFEYQGEQHYRYIKQFHRNGPEDLEKQKRHDETKRKECKKRNIQLIETPYNISRDKIFKYIIQELKKRNIGTKESRELDWRTLNLSNDGKMQEMHQIAKERKGKCLSTQYIDSKTRLQWECEKGHRWWKSPSGIKRHWCITCSGKKRLDVEIIKKYINSKGGKLLSKDNEYKNNTSTLEIECNLGHKWKTSWQSLKGHWCSACSGNKKGSIEEFKTIAKEREGECLSLKYTNNSTPLRFRCAKKHEWTALPSNVKNKGSWCPKCYYEKRKKPRK